MHMRLSMIRPLLLLTVFLPMASGCGLLQLPFALAGAALAVVAIPVNLAASLIGPATNAAAAAAPYALMMVKRDACAEEHDLYFFENSSGLLKADFDKAVREWSQRRVVASAYPAGAKAFEDLVREKNMRCYLVKV